jgi:mannose-6-phosphate isomerase-like protein (cupin superfamily)
MQQVAIDAVEPATDGRGRERRGLTGGLGLTDVAVNHYTVAPGERVSGLHGHGDQEEVFLVLEGTATFETYDGEEGRVVEVDAGEAVRFAPGEYQSARNAGEEPLVCYALGAPPDSEDVRVPLACPDCGHGHVRPTLADDRTPVLACPDCDAETAVECPDCGSDAMHAVLGDGGDPVSACRECGYASSTL